MSTTQHTGGIAHEEKEVGPLTPRSDEVIEFCQSHAIESYLAKAEELAARLFPQVVRISVLPSDAQATCQMSSSRPFSVA